MDLVAHRHAHSFSTVLSVLDLTRPHEQLEPGPVDVQVIVLVEDHADGAGHLRPGLVVDDERVLRVVLVVGRGPVEPLEIK